MHTKRIINDKVHFTQAINSKKISSNNCHASQMPLY
jgi:hypothetical protein